MFKLIQLITVELLNLLRFKMIFLQNKLDYTIMISTVKIH